MPVYHLEIAITLTVLATGSLTLFVLLSPRPGTIQLPSLNQESNGHDPFDVTKPEDRLDGYPIKAAQFWETMKRRRILTCMLLATLLTLEITGFALNLLHGEDQAEFLPSILECAYSFYLFCVGIISLSQVERHDEFVYHLTSLTTLPAALLSFAAIIPDRQPSANLLSLWFPYTVLFLYIVLALTTLNTPLGPALHYPLSAIYPEDVVETATISETEENVTGVVGSSPWGTLYFSYIGKVVSLGARADGLELGDLPIMPAYLRATLNYEGLKTMVQRFKLSLWFWKPRSGSGLTLAYQLFHANLYGISVEAALAAAAALLYYIPPFCLSRIISYLEGDPNREDMGWGWFWVVALFVVGAISSLLRGQLWTFCSTNVKLQMRVQLSALLLAKTLVRRDAASFATSSGLTSDTEGEEKNVDNTENTSKSQIMTLMTTDVGRVGDSTWYIFDVIDAPIEVAIGACFLYQLLGKSLMFIVLLSCAQDKLLKARDERMGLMNEVLGAIRMIKFMALERKFEARAMVIRDRELKYQRLTYTITVLWNAIWNGSPMLVTLVSFWHFAVVRQQHLTPSIAFTSVVFNELRFALSAIPNSVIKILQVVLSLRRIEKYLELTEVAPVPPLQHQPRTVVFESCSVTWPKNISSSTPSNTPNKFVLTGLDLAFPAGELSLICGKLGSGKSLLLLALLGEAEVVAGRMICPRSPPDFIASMSGRNIAPEEWIIQGLCAYVPQVAWLRNTSIKENILFHLPFDQERYERTLKAYLKIWEDGDETICGERGITLSGGQKARDSRASILLLDDVLSAVDAHTAHHLYHACLKGNLVTGRTIILVSHHINLCSMGASFIVALDNGRVQFQGDRQKFHASKVIGTLMQSTAALETQEDGATESEPLLGISSTTAANSVTTSAPESGKAVSRKVEQEARSVGRVALKVWETYIRACGGSWYWAAFLGIFGAAAGSAVLENGWLSYWSSGRGPDDPVYYITIYTIVRSRSVGLILTTGRWLVLYAGSITASSRLYKRLLEAVLFAELRFHDTSSRGRLLNRFGKDFEGIDSDLADHLGHCVLLCLGAITSLVTIAFIGGIPFVIIVIILGVFFYNATLTTKSPIYSAYSENIAGAAVIRAFGASSKILRDVLRCIDANSNAFYWTWGLNRWLSIRFDFLAGAVTCSIAAICILNKNIPASLAGMALAFSNSIRRWVQLEQAMVCVERVNEYCEIQQEPPEFIEPRPPANWPSAGAIECRDLVIRYAPELPAVLHNISFSISPGQKVGVLGRTGSGKSTLALSFLRFVAPSQGSITIDDLDISQVGLSDLRSKITIIPQDPIILSGTLRSTLDIFGEYSDAEIFEALRRVHLISSGNSSGDTPAPVNQNTFRDLDSLVSEGGENFSAGEKQLLCMARALLKKSKILIMDELIGKSISEEFAQSTILTIAHRIRSVIHYDKVLSFLELYFEPRTLLSDSSSQFYALCKATGPEEFAMLKKLAAL
ncbi:multidrug resistance-associated ABC transporter [Favolaschia claudopus]|uniref:Multidrug resistance-associated ABC transporter n=1 Tax=Favolaschia claudopus TaxID=2862362 RepID=A0AAW0EAM1_9AGAR